MTERMTNDEYRQWWINLPDDYGELGEPLATLAEHVDALQSRIDLLPEHELGCRDLDHRCCCAYDHPDDV